MHIDQRQTTVSRISCAAWLALLVVLLGSSRASAATDQDRHPRKTAQEVCEPMVRDSVIAATNHKLTGAPTRTWQDDHFTCTYSFGARGAIVVTVDVLAGDAAARKTYATLRQGASHRSTLFGIGQRAYRSGLDVIVAQKDRFILTVDGRALAQSLHPDEVTWSTTRAIFKCW